MDQLQKMSIKPLEKREINGIKYIVVYKQHNRYMDKFCTHCNKHVTNYHVHKKSKKHLINAGLLKKPTVVKKSYNKEYYEKNKQKNHLKKVRCEACDCTITKASLPKHLKSKKHLKNVS